MTIIFSDTWSEHLNRVRSLLSKLSSANLVINLTKCEFVKAKVQYLSYVIGQGDVVRPLAKVETICNLPTPKTKRELRRFLGMIGYYRKFITNFTTILSSHWSIKKNVKFAWNEKCKVVFKQLKAIFCCDSPDFVTWNASVHTVQKPAYNFSSHYTL